MSQNQNPEYLTFATQGGELSYHALAARMAAGSIPVELDRKKKFGDVVHASRSNFPGLGVVAVSTVVGTVDDSVRELVCVRPSALPPIVGRVDVPVSLSLIGTSDQSLDKLSRLKPKVHCLAQKPAWEQTDEYRRKHLPWLVRELRGETTDALEEMMKRADRDWIAIGPSFAARELGAFILGPQQINPTNSITSFYVLQRDPRQQLLPIDESKTSPRTIISLAHPEGDGEFAKCIELAQRLGIDIARFIPFDIGDFTKHNNNLRRGGGLLELAHDLYDEELTDWCARVNKLVSNDGIDGPFGTKKLGSYLWYPDEPHVDPDSLLPSKAKHALETVAA